MTETNPYSKDSELEFVIVDLTAGLGLLHIAAGAMDMKVVLGVIGHGTQRSLSSTKRRFPSSRYLRSCEFTVEFADSILKEFPRAKVLVACNALEIDTHVNMCLAVLVF